MKMMYLKIADALNELGLSDCSHPQDYLNFYCLGKRESYLEKSSTHSSNGSFVVIIYASFNHLGIIITN